MELDCRDEYRTLELDCKIGLSNIIDKIFPFLRYISQGTPLMHTDNQTCYRQYSLQNASNYDAKLTRFREPLFAESSTLGTGSASLFVFLFLFRLTESLASSYMSRELSA